jgi:hypothetical protein
MNKLLFVEAIQKVKSSSDYTNSIGTLNEKSVHAVLKRYYEPSEDSHEIKIGGYVADIVGEQGIIEIQTGSFDRLVKKLTAFLAVTRVTVVYPIVTKKRVYNISTGKVYASPKKGTIWHFLSEVGKLRALSPETAPINTHAVINENLSFRLCLITADELRKGTGRKAEKLDIIPTGLVDEILLETRADWHIFTDPLPESFTMKDFEAASKLRGMDAWTALKGLCATGITAKTGKRGNAFLYEKI